MWPLLHTASWSFQRKTILFRWLSCSKQNKIPECFPLLLEGNLNSLVQCTGPPGSSSWVSPASVHGFKARAWDLSSSKLPTHFPSFLGWIVPLPWASSPFSPFPDLRGLLDALMVRSPFLLPMTPVSPWMMSPVRLFCWMPGCTRAGLYVICWPSSQHLT